MNRRAVSTDYAALWCKSNYSFLEGASHPEELVEQAHRLGLRALALTDRDGVYGVVRAHVRARELGLPLVLGSQVTLDDGSTLVLLVQNRRGYANLCRLISTGRLRCPKGESRVTWQEVCARHEGLLALWGGDPSLLVQKADPLFVARDLRDAFEDRLYAMVTRHQRADEVRTERRLRERAARYRIPTVAAIEVLYHVPARRDLQDVLTCIRHGVTLTTAGRLIKPNAQHALASPHAFAMLFADDIPSVLRTREIAERCRFSLAEIHYRYPAEAGEPYPVDAGERPQPRGARRAVPGDRSESSPQRLRRLTYEGATERYPPGRHPEGIPADVREQIEKELALVHELEYDGYFLTMWEIVQFCRREGILCQGRGSAANSAVCYCLGITAVDPVRMGLLFERFLSRERAEPPDIDLDIEHQRREEVIQYVYQRYGREHAAMVANFIRYRARSAAREVGKVLALPETAVDRLAKLLSYDEVLDPAVLQQAGFDPHSRIHQHLLRLTLEIQDFPRHLSIHPGGFLLGHEPVCELVPVENAAMEDRTVIQWDKEDLEDLGLFKVDLLGLGALTVLDLSFRLLREHRGETVSMATLPPDDEPTFEMIRRADTVGVFQIESRAQMAMLPRLRPHTYYDLVIEVSIVRPGPITGGMVHPYLRRRNGEEEITYPHPSLVPVLEKTLGVPLFQEQVMKLAVVAADYTPGEADQLRRDMAAWRSTGRLERHRDRLVSRMESKGIAHEFAERVFEQIRGFGEYGFPESHAASFALIAYATAWLKRHQPAVFTCALLNAQPMGFYAPATLVDDTKRHGVDVRPVDVTASDWDCTLEPVSQSSDGAGSSDTGSSGTGSRGTGSRGTGSRGTGSSDAAATRGGGTGNAGLHETAIRMGLRTVKGLAHRDGLRIVEARQSHPFRSLPDLAMRASLERSTLVRLAEAGALESLERDRRRALWTVHGWTYPSHPQLALDATAPTEDIISSRGADASANRGPGTAADPATDTTARRKTNASANREPDAATKRDTNAPADPIPDFAPLSLLETIGWDYGATDHSPRGHPLMPLREELAARGIPDAISVQRMPDGSRVRYAGIVICRQRPGTAGGVVFMTLEDETGFVNVVLWKKVFAKHRVLAKTASFLGVTGTLQVGSGVVHLIAESLWSPETIDHPRPKKSRDFH